MKNQQGIQDGLLSSLIQRLQDAELDCILGNYRQYDVLEAVYLQLVIMELLDERYGKHTDRTIRTGYTKRSNAYRRA